MSGKGIPGGDQLAQKHGREKCSPIRLTSFHYALGTGDTEVAELDEVSPLQCGGRMGRMGEIWEGFSEEMTFEWRREGSMELVQGGWRAERSRQGGQA